MSNLLDFDQWGDNYGIPCHPREIDFRNFQKLIAYGLAFWKLAFNLYRRNMTLSCVIVVEDAVIDIVTKPLITGGRLYYVGLRAKA